MNLLPLPAFDDNYIWLLHDGARALVVDPGDAVPVFEALDRLGLDLAAILVTHHHGDHTGGVADLLDRYAQARALGMARGDLAGRVDTVEDGQGLTLLGLDWQVLFTPGHTLDHVSFYSAGAEGRAPLLFCGDTMFSAGCGRLFEGRPEQMARSLQRLAALPADTQVCCAHEYTLANLRFAMAVDPDNAPLAAYQQRCAARRAEHRPTLPARLGVELLINPFLRCTEPAVVRSAQARGADPSDPVSVFAALRQWKNEFR
jgi:hydroxyacylglutathione hydrolase